MQQTLECFNLRKKDFYKKTLFLNFRFINCDLAKILTINFLTLKKELLIYENHYVPKLV